MYPAGSRINQERTSKNCRPHSMEVYMSLARKIVREVFVLLGRSIEGGDRHYHSCSLYPR